MQAVPTVIVNPRLGALDRKPWRDLDLTAVTGQTIELRHVHDVYLNENLVPYCLRQPLRAALPIRQGDCALPFASEGVGGIILVSVDPRMRSRWQTISRMWEENKQESTKDNLAENLDHFGKLVSQLRWQEGKAGRPIRVVHSQGGQPTAAILSDDDAFVDESLYWIPCKDIPEANFLLAIINSDALQSHVNPYTTPNWAGNTRNLHKHLWKLPIPEHDANELLHRKIADAGSAAATGAALRLVEMQSERRGHLTGRTARAELRQWLRNSQEGQAVEV